MNEPFTGNGQGKRDQMKEYIETVTYGEKCIAFLLLFFFYYHRHFGNVLTFHNFKICIRIYWVGNYFQLVFFIRTSIINHITDNICYLFSNLINAKIPIMSGLCNP